MYHLSAGAPPSSLSSEAAAAVAASNDQKEALVKQPVKHVLSQELQLYFDRVARMLRGGDEEGRRLRGPAPSSGPSQVNVPSSVQRFLKQGVISWESSTLLEIRGQSPICDAGAPMASMPARSALSLHSHLSLLSSALQCHLPASAATSGVCRPGKAP